MITTVLRHIRSRNEGGRRCPSGRRASSLYAYESASALCTQLIVSKLFLERSFGISVLQVLAFCLHVRVALRLRKGLQERLQARGKTWELIYMANGCRRPSMGLHDSPGSPKNTPQKRNGLSLDEADDGPLIDKEGKYGKRYKVRLAARPWIMCIGALATDCKPVLAAALESCDGLQ